jgi:hypothetical protein
LLLRGISLLLGRVVHGLLLLGVIALLLLAVALLWVKALLLGLVAVVVCCGAGAGTLGWG